ncbi:hypothetical protein WKW80_19225 [Variovorax humicola]|uniref:Lycopene cyclase domain-containing protein n=1 Tax=Variovorax humicola TaxID=1769758 RepID=A0ABU8W4I3_9BURK
MTISNSVFAELSFWLMAIASVALPIAIYAVLLAKRAVSRTTVLVLGFTLVAIAGLDIYFLRHMAAAAAMTSSLADDALFLSELSFALYLFPLMFGGIGVNLISHVLISHLVDAEQRFDREHAEDRRD